ncbi:hypothetical protein NL676_024532 [Syzygium grande]|nr:hypothetical protein NL676_024532 [Syzygium grande]
MANQDPRSPTTVATSLRGSPCPNGDLDEVAHGIGGLDPSSQHNGRPWIEAQVAVACLRARQRLNQQRDRAQPPLLRRIPPSQFDFRFPLC